MSTNQENSDRLDSWKEIAAYVGRNVRTVVRWEQRGGLPVYRIPVGQRQAVYAFKHEIDEWMTGDGSGSNALGALLEVASERQNQLNGTAVAVVAPPIKILARKGIPLTFSLSAIWTSAAIAVVLAAFSLHTVLTPPHFVLTGETQVLNDGTMKTGLVTDGSHLYFGEFREGRIVLSRVSVNGGPVHEIPSPFIQTEPMSISPDGRRLLVLAGQGVGGQDPERGLWILPAQGGPPRRVGTFLCHSAAWSPDGRRIAFAFGNSIYITTNDGLQQSLLQTFSTVPQDLRWSLDGRRVLFRLRNMTTWDSVLWEIVLSDTDRNAVASLLPLSVAPTSYNTISPVIDGEDDAFVSTDGDATTILTLERSRWPWGAKFEFTQFAHELTGVGDFAIDSQKHQLYLLKGSPGQDELDSFDKNSREFRPFLPGISARDVDFSRDGRWIAYVRVPNDSLWLAAPDGSSPRQISTPGMTGIELPRWSPDGTEIAFMGKRAKEPYRIFVVPAAGGALREASSGTDNQGAPTWSPDGRHLLYGRVMCQEERTCAVQEIDLDTGQEHLIPGSEGLSTARWSPDGRFIAALRANTHQVLLLNRQTGEWRKLADGVNGNDLAWATDSSAVYASKPGGDRPEVIRISLSGRHAEPVVDLSSFSKLSGRIDTWFAVTPDDSILFLHIASGHEICALHYAVR